MFVRFGIVKKKVLRKETVWRQNRGDWSESEDKRSTIGAHQKGANMHRYNSLLDPNLAVYDLDTIEINPRILDRTLE